MLKSDVAKAHRRFKHLEADWGLLGCRSGVGEGVWLNRVGTFGVSSAPYWWQRLCGIVGRFGFAFLPPGAPLFGLVFSDDLLWLAH
eukprot:6339956-Amphidinium_carterae.1